MTLLRQKIVFSCRDPLRASKRCVHGTVIDAADFERERIHAGVTRRFAPRERRSCASRRQQSRATSSVAVATAMPMRARQPSTPFGAAARK